MKTLFAALPATAALFCTIIAQAQSADEIISKHIAAIGGREKISQIQSLCLQGTVESGSRRSTQITTIILNGKGYKSEFGSSSRKHMYVLNEDWGWQYSAEQGNSWFGASPVQWKVKPGCITR